ncbi:aminoglycoside phosphotransferase [Mycobacterium sp. SWH-M3]|nr:aminoglycoside phosphotransferase [Mycobacterium sp. SWH-M3]
MTIPADTVAVPGIVTHIAAGRPVKAVWDNEVAGHTFQLGSGAEREFVKVAPPHPSVNLTAEADKLAWAGPFLTVPRVLGIGRDGALTWLHTAGLPGRSAVDPQWVARPHAAVTAIGKGLRALHDRLPVEDCPYDWSVRTRLAGLDEAARRALPAAPPVDRLVVCHGDACAPNTLIADDGQWCGHVDFGDLGVADRWADLAVASLSLEWNYPGDWADVFFTAYGVAPDPARIDYYRQLWNAED